MTKEIEAFENSLCAQCFYCYGSGTHAVAFAQIHCRFCGGSGLMRTVRVSTVAGTYYYTARNIYKPAPYLDEDK